MLYASRRSSATLWNCNLYRLLVSFLIMRLEWASFLGSTFWTNKDFSQLSSRGLLLGDVSFRSWARRRQGLARPGSRSRGRPAVRCALAASLLRCLAPIARARSLLFNMLSRVVIAFLPRSKCLLISWQQSPSAATLEPKKIKVSRCCHFFPI